jgi:hypothetical protein
MLRLAVRERHNFDASSARNHCTVKTRISVFGGESIIDHVQNLIKVLAVDEESYESWVLGNVQMIHAIEDFMAMMMRFEDAIVSVQVVCF